MPIAPLHRLNVRTSHRLLIPALLAMFLWAAWHPADRAIPSDAFLQSTSATFETTTSGDGAPAPAPDTLDTFKKSRRHVVSLVDIPLPPGTEVSSLVARDVAPKRLTQLPAPLRDSYRPPSPASEVRFEPLRGQPPPFHA